MSEITVVIPNYNGMKYLAECMTSLCREQQNAPGYEVLIIDNASVDGSVEYLQKEWCGEGVRLISLPENTGFCHAVNLGIREAKTPYVILLNNDTKAEAGFVRGLYDAIRENEKIFSVSAKMLMWDRPELIDDAGDRYCVLGWAYSRGKGRPAADYDKSVPVFSACGGAAIYRRSVFEEIGYFDEEHFASTGSRYNPRKTLLASANSIYVIGKNMPLLQCILNLPFFWLGFGIKFLFFCKKRMGKLYLKGLAAGLKRSVGTTGRQHKVPFRWHHLGNYVKIQWQLYFNVFRILMKS